MAWETPHVGGWARNFRFGEWLGDPITPLFETWLLPTLEKAFWKALRRIADMPTPEPTYVVVHGWYFTSLNFWPSHPLGWLWQIARHPRLMRVMLQFVPGLADWALAPWVREWRAVGLPRYHAVVEDAEARVEELSADRLVELVDGVGAAAGEYFAWIALVAGAAYKTEAPLARFYRKHAFPVLGGGHQRLLSGLSDRTLPAASHAVYGLDWWQPTLVERGRAVRTSAAARGAEETDRADGGMRSAERAFADVRAALAGRPRRLSEFERLLETARRYAVLREEIVSAFTLGWPVLRRAALRLGDQLARAGALDTEDDVFFVTREELIGTFRPGVSERLTDRVLRRRQEWDRRRKLVPPLRLGEVPATFRRGLDQLETDLAPDAMRAGAAVRGLPASPGRASGPVRIIRGPAEFDLLQTGDVLVAPATAPAWTPLFVRACAVVTDTGGVLAHTSLVAREYGIPAVVGTGDATARLRDGQLVSVDGDTGAIELLPNPLRGDA